MKAEAVTKDLSIAHSQLLNVFPDYLRTDAYLVSLICVIFLFRDCPGISNSQIIEEERSYYIQLLDIYVKAKIKSKEWKDSYDVVCKSIHEVLTQAVDFKKRNVFEKFAAERQRMLDEEIKAAQNKFVSVKQLPSSNLIFKVSALKIRPVLFERSAVIEVTVKDGVVVGTSSTIDEILKQGNDYVYQSDESTGDQIHIDFKARDGCRTSFLPHRENEVTSEVIITTFRSNIQSVMEKMNESLWRRLTQVASAASLLQQTFNAVIDILPDAPDSFCEQEVSGFAVQKKLTLNITWQSVIKTITKSFDFITSFHSLPAEDQLILRKEATTEVLIIQMVGTFDKDMDSFVHNGIQGHLLLCTKFKMFSSDLTETTFYQSLRTLTYEFDDTLRRDEVVMTLLCMLCLFKDRSGIIYRDLIQEERMFFLELLDRYIKGKVASKEWITPTHVLWDRIHRDMARVSSLKSLFENMSATLL